MLCGLSVRRWGLRARMGMAMWMNRPAEARDAASRAVALGGPTLNAARETLRQVEAGR